MVAKYCQTTVIISTQSMVVGLSGQSGVTVLLPALAVDYHSGLEVVANHLLFIMEQIVLVIGLKTKLVMSIFLVQVN